MHQVRRLIAAFVVTALTGACSGGGGTTQRSSDSTPVESDPSVADLSIRPGRANWSTGYFQAALYATLLEELGYDVSDPALNEYPPPEAYVAMAEGTFDFWPNGWFSQHYTWFDTPVADGSTVEDNVVVLGNEIEDGSIEGLVITKSVVDDHGIESLDQINDDPQLVALFDSDGDGLGEIHGCPDDWTCDDIITELIEFNRWSNLQQIKAGYPGLIAATIEQVQNDLPVIQYVWSPSGYLADLVPGETVVWLSVGSRDHVLDGSTEGGYDFSDADPAALGSSCTADPCWTGWEVADIRVAANKSFAAANPSAVALFEVVELNVADIADQNVRYENGENTEADIRRHAQEWIEANRALVEQWLDVATAAAR